MTAVRSAWWASSAFAEFIPYLRAIAAHDVRDGKHARIELASSTPWLLAQRALELRVPCAACSRPMPPFRARHSPAKRGGTTGNIYLAATCPQAVNSACSRGHAAAEAYDAIESLIASQCHDLNPPTSQTQPRLGL